MLRQAPTHDWRNTTQHLALGYHEPAKSSILEYIIWHVEGFWQVDFVNSMLFTCHGCAQCKYECCFLNLSMSNGFSPASAKHYLCCSEPTMCLRDHALYMTVLICVLTWNTKCIWHPHNGKISVWYTKLMFLPLKALQILPYTFPSQWYHIPCVVTSKPCFCWRWLRNDLPPDHSTLIHLCWLPRGTLVLFHYCSKRPNIPM